MKRLLLFVLPLLIVGMGIVHAQSFTPAQIEQVKLNVNKAVNGYRQGQRLNALTMKANISALALEHSQNMATGRTPFSHDGIQDRQARVQKMLNPGISYIIAENVYACNGFPASQVPQQALEGWRNSPGHKKNMDGKFAITGIGVAVSKSGEVFVTQLFVGKK